MSKITTQDCIAAIKATNDLPQIVLNLAPKWKRVSKTGKKGEPVVRVFTSDEAPFIKAIVTETLLGDLHVQFAQRHLWETKIGDDIDWTEFENWLTNPEISALPGPVANDFLFGVTDEEGDLYVFLQPKANPMWDQHLSDAVYALLPPRLDGRDPVESSESTFEMDHPDAETLKAAMLEKGFTHDPEMDGEMGC